MQSVKFEAPLENKRISVCRMVVKNLSLLMVGVDVASIASSASNAGYKVYAVDYFGDQDLRRVSKKFFSIINQKRGESCGRLGVDFNLEMLLKGAREISKKNHIDAILLSTGLDDSFEVLSELSEIAPILGNSPRLVRRVRDKERFFSELKRLGLHCPETVLTGNLREALKASEGIGYPVLVKPPESFGGTGIRKACNSTQLKRAFESTIHKQDVLIQKYVRGVHASASVISSGCEAVTLTVNEQLLGLRSVGQKEPFGYCGNIVPLSASEEVMSECSRMAKKIILQFGLLGSNGVDFVISEDNIPYVIEVNPRFQGTLECVERVLGINLVEAHIKACIEGVLPKVQPEVSRFCTRLIIYAPHRSVVPDLSSFPNVRDVPIEGVIVEEGEPVCSVITDGEDRESSFRKANDIAEKILCSLKKIAA